MDAYKMDEKGISSEFCAKLGQSFNRNPILYRE